MEEKIAMFKRNTMQLHCIPQLVNGICKCKTLTYEEANLKNYRFF